MKLGRRLVRVAFVSLVVVGLCACISNREYELVLLHTNDSHGSVLAVDSLGGLAERATFIQLVRKGNPHVLLVDAGDMNTGQAISNRANAEPDIMAYNYMEYDAVTVGNHEFDKPLTVLQKQIQAAAFPFITSNVFFNGETLGHEYFIKEIDGIRVGILGLTTKSTGNISIHAAEVEFRDEIETARRMIKILKAQKVDLIIGLVHLGFTESDPDFTTSYKLARQVDGIDILVDGHSHSYIEQPERINQTWIVTANQSGRYVGEGKLKIKNGHLVGFDWKPVLIKKFPPDSVLVRKLQPYVMAAEEDLQTVVGTATETFGIFRNGDNMARCEESALGNLIADALKWKAQELRLKVDFALTNSGGVRDGLPAGKITKGDILAVLPFDNVLEVVALQGSEIRRLFDFLATVPSGNGAFAQISQEVKVVYNKSAKKVETLTIADQPIDDSRIYYMATCDYVAAGKDGYEAGIGNQISKENTSLAMSEVVMDYIRMKKQITPRIEERIRFVE